MSIIDKIQVDGITYEIQDTTARRAIAVEAYDSLTQIAELVRGGSIETNKALFPIGDQLIIPWKDMDDTNHNTDQTAYQVAWDIVHHGEVELQGGVTVPGMFLQMHFASAYGVQFSHQQAFKDCPSGLAAGTYYITFGDTWGSNGASANTSWQFTLTQAVPAGGRLSGFEGLPDQASSAWRIKSWATPGANEPIETVTVSSGTSGTNLGTMKLATNNNGLNTMQRVGYGLNRWSKSAIRQYLNKSGADWWESQDDYDIRPDQYGKKGFMTGFDSEFLEAIKPVKVTTALNTADGYTDATENTYDTFFLPSLQQMNITQQLADAEGHYFEYWRTRLGLTGYAGIGSSNVFDAFKIPAINSSSAQTIWLRSVRRASGTSTFYIRSQGYVADYNSSPNNRFMPVCVIC